MDVLASVTQPTSNQDQNQYQIFFFMHKYSKPKKDCIQSTEFHGMMKLFKLEKIFKIIRLYYKPNTAKTH